MYIDNPRHIYVSMSKIHTNSKQASIIRELIRTNAYSAQLTCSLTLIFDWSEKLYLSKFWPKKSTAGEWSKFGHKDLILTTLLKEQKATYGKMKPQTGKKGHFYLKDVAR